MKKEGLIPAHKNENTKSCERGDAFERSGDFFMEKKGKNLS